MVESFRGVVTDVYVDLLAVSFAREAESAGQRPDRRCSVLLHRTGSARGREGGRRGSPRDPATVVREASIAASCAFIHTLRDVQNLSS